MEVPRTLLHNGLGSVKNKLQSLEVVFLVGESSEVVGNMGQRENLVSDSELGFIGSTRVCLQNAILSLVCAIGMDLIALSQSPSIVMAVPMESAGAVSLVPVTARFGPSSGGYSEACFGSKLTAGELGVFFFTKIKASAIVTGRNDDCRGKCSHLQGAQGVVDIDGGNPIAGDAGLIVAEDGFQNDAIHNSVLDARDDSMQMISGTLMVVGGKPNGTGIHDRLKHGGQVLVVEMLCMVGCSV
ncbi:hypothetical protein NE237_013833 [Protea cynaroides]|uniref:Uncharacterized protein n=1 Tax=Protea cynaroides TaxID=273540 RepID=A0A9Q0K062_9MAGN|nr:hypothetical protein NE237_013833 [Protea cynaroides]